MVWYISLFLSISLRVVFRSTQLWPFDRHIRIFNLFGKSLTQRSGITTLFIEKMLIYFFFACLHWYSIDFYFQMIFFSSWMMAGSIGNNYWRSISWGTFKMEEWNAWSMVRKEQRKCLGPTIHKQICVRLLNMENLHCSKSVEQNRKAPITLHDWYSTTVIDHSPYQQHILFVFASFLRFQVCTARKIYQAWGGFSLKKLNVVDQKIALNTSPLKASTNENAYNISKRKQ